MNSYNVFFEDIFWGHVWADTAWDAIQKIAGDVAFPGVLDAEIWVDGEVIAYVRRQQGKVGY